MITKGIVEEVIGYKAKVRLPIFHALSNTKNSLSTRELTEATICSLANISDVVNVGDVVWVGFEDNDQNKPIILGHLYRETKTETTPSLKLGMLITTSTTNLSENTQIGKVVAKEIQRLTGVKDNIQRQFDVLVKKDSELSETLQKSINAEAEAREKADTAIEKEIEDINTTITEANLDNLVTKKGQDQEIESNKTFKGNVVIDSNTAKNEGGLVIFGQAATHPLRVRGISGIKNGSDEDDALYLNYDSTSDLSKYKERPVYLGGLDNLSIAVRQDMLDNAIANVKKEILTGDSEEKISETYDTLLEISNWITDDESGAAKIVADLNRVVFKNSADGTAINQAILGDLSISGNLLLNDGQVYVNASKSTAADVNTLTKPGQYGIASNSTNIPIAQAGILYVAEYASGRWCQQTYITNPDEGDIRIFRRGALTSTSSSWSEWSEVLATSKAVVDHNAFELHWDDSDGNFGLEIGRKDGSTGTPYIDFHSDGNSNDVTDYNARIIVTGNNLDIKTINGGSVTINGNPITTTTNAVIVDDVKQEIAGEKVFNGIVRINGTLII